MTSIDCSKVEFLILGEAAGIQLAPPPTHSPWWTVQNVKKKEVGANRIVSWRFGQQCRSGEQKRVNVSERRAGKGKSREV
ncbi:hypothetical protein E2C01_027233 [Portunus trituberculatus]|uniref:Uncharacterized protein n=1 Tax=Portunus trituberculatus TaxID=210409 RepID=A0A5B7EL02_PORTR|nr:hypothetical protein [Portunus trituberculatus]